MRKKPKLEDRVETLARLFHRLQTEAKDYARETTEFRAAELAKAATRLSETIRLMQRKEAAS